MKPMSIKERKCADAVLRFDKDMTALKAPYILAVAENYEAETGIVSGSVPTEETLDLIRDIIQAIADLVGVNAVTVAQDIVKRVAKQQNFPRETESIQKQLGIRCWLGSGICDKEKNEIIDGDILSIDFEHAAKLIGDGSLIHDLQTLKPASNARLIVEFRQARFNVVWRTDNGCVDPQIDLHTLSAIAQFVSVIGHVTERKDNDT